MKPLHLNRRRVLRGALGLALPAALPLAAHAAYPEQAVHLVVAYTAGSANDIIGRLIARALGAQLGRTVVVENRPGAGGSTGTAHVARATPDGHKLVVMSNGTLAINPVVIPSVGYDVRRDFVPVGLVGATPNLLVVAADGPWTSTGRLLAGAREAAAARRPLLYASGGVGTTQHLLGVLLGRHARAPVEHVPYPGPSEGLLGVVRGEAAFSFTTLPAALPLVRSGQLRVLGSSSAVDPAVLPDVPTLGAQGLTDFDDADIWFNVSAPRATGEAVVRVLNEAFVAMTRDPDFIAGLKQAGYRPAPPLAGERLEAFLERQIGFWGPLARLATDATAVAGARAGSAARP